MNFEFDNDKPIYKQLLEQFKIAIVTNYYKSGDKLPSVRDLAIQLCINPNTIQRALQELEKEHLIFTKRTAGKFVTEDSSIIQQVRVEIAIEKIDRFVADMKKLHLTQDEVYQLLKERNK